MVWANDKKTKLVNHKFSSIIFRIHWIETTTKQNHLFVLFFICILLVFFFLHRSCWALAEVILSFVRQFYFFIFCFVLILFVFTWIPIGNRFFSFIFKWEAHNWYCLLIQLLSKKKSIKKDKSKSEFWMGILLPSLQNCKMYRNIIAHTGNRQQNK